MRTGAASIAATMSTMKQQELLTQHMVQMLTQSMELAQLQASSVLPSGDSVQISPEALALLEAELGS